MKTEKVVAGDRALFLNFDNRISPDINRKVHLLTSFIEKEKGEGILELVPTYRSLCIYYDPVKLSLKDLKTRLSQIEHELERTKKTPPARVLEIPVVYGGEYGPDLGFVASSSGLSEEEVIQIHSGSDYLIYMCGFSPGFSYLGGLDERIATPRLKTPRMKVPAGSVGIAEAQTGIYPLESAGGWRLIGRTPLKLFHPYKDPPIPFVPGDYFRFMPVSEEEYQKILEKVSRGDYKILIHDSQ
jgi:KipI family sensor histidine kinase inhibitor